MNTTEKKKLTFAERHPRWNTLFAFLILASIVMVSIWLLKFLFKLLKESVANIFVWISDISSNLDAVVIVALISGVISILGVLLSSIVAKSLDYKRARREYLTQKREKPYGEYIDMIYKLQQSSKPGKSYPQDEMIEDLLKFSKQITLWGSPRVVNNWVKFREVVTRGDKGIENLLITEQLMNDMRKDLGLSRVKKGNLLAFFINDIKEAMKK